MYESSAHKAWGCVQYTRLMLIVMVAFKIGKQSNIIAHTCGNLPLASLGAGLNNRLDTMNTKSNKKHVSCKQSFTLHLSFMFIFTDWKTTTYGAELTDSGAKTILEYISCGFTLNVMLL